MGQTASEMPVTNCDVELLNLKQKLIQRDRQLLDTKRRLDKSEMDMLECRRRALQSGGADYQEYVRMKQKYMNSKNGY